MGWRGGLLFCTAASLSRRMMKTTYEFEAVHFVYHGVKTESLNHTAQLYGTILSHAGLTAVENENTL